LIAFWRAQRAEVDAIPVARTLANLHPVIAPWLKEDEARQRQWGASMAFVRLSALERRRLRVLSALFKALEARGVRVVCAPGTLIVALRHGQDETTFELWEYVQQKRRPLTEEERAQSWNAHSKYRVEQTATGLLRGKVTAWQPAGVPLTWTANEDTPFEQLLGDVITTILTALAYVRAQREEREDAERKRWEAQQEAERREDAAKAERARRQALRDRARAWREAQDLRAYIAAVTDGVGAGRIVMNERALADWTLWALSCARELDPLTSGAAARLETGREQG